MPIIKEDPLRRYNPSDFNFKSVKGEVNEAMQFDWKRDKVDDAKKKAIYDSRNYDEFKSRVAGCTLRPIHKDEFNAPPKFVYNRQAQKASDGPLGMAKSKEAQTVLSVASASRASAGRKSGRVPRTCHEFEREFRRRSAAKEKVALLSHCNEAYSQIFAKELDVEVFRQLLEALDEADGADAEPRVARLFLTAVVADCPSATAGAAAFITGQERTIIARLLAREPAANAEDDVRICASFGVPTSSVAEQLLAAQEALQEEAARGGLDAAAASVEASKVESAVLEAAPAEAATSQETPTEPAQRTEAAPLQAASDLAISAESATVPDLAAESSIQGGYDAMD